MNPLPLLQTVSLVLLGGLIASDFRRREIDAIPLALLGAVNMSIEGLECGWPWLGFRVALNLVLLGLLCLLLWFHVGVIRRRVYGGSLRRAIGAGDLLFLPVLAPLFELREFVLFLTAAFLFSLLTCAALWGLKRQKTPSIPLVGTVGICYLIYFFYSLCFNV